MRASSLFQKRLRLMSASSLSPATAAPAALSLPMFKSSPGLLGNLLTSLPSRTGQAGSLPHEVRPLPMSMEEAKARGWDELDIVFITGDAYIDHPSFAMAILGRVLEAAGFRVGIVSQPD